ncbi:hypothetical protein GCM10009639_09440 [Kitasatospora putterlickiae]|uniref:Uncharacterized protein n=1 Tax=Kitasatospora putterlickiae TaxID=221725 RepID=A0ABN1XPC5_9ACTN
MQPVSAGPSRDGQTDGTARILTDRRTSDMSVQSEVANSDRRLFRETCGGGRAGSPSALNRTIGADRPTGSDQARSRSIPSVQ